MKVYNLTTSDYTYKRVIIPANGGCVDIPMDFIPNRDLKLQKAGVLAFGALPKYWTPAKPVVAEEVKPLGKLPPGTKIEDVVQGEGIAIGNQRSVEKLDLKGTKTRK